MPSNCGLYVEDKIFQNPLKREQILICINHWDWDLDGEMGIPEYDERLAHYGFSREMFDNLTSFVKEHVQQNGGSGGGCLQSWCDCYSDKFCNYCYCYLTLGLAYILHSIVKDNRKARNMELRRQFETYARPMQEGAQWQLSLVTDPNFVEYGKDSPWRYPGAPVADVMYIYGAMIVLTFPSAIPWPEDGASSSIPPVITHNPYAQPPAIMQNPYPQQPIVTQNPYAQPPPPQPYNVPPCAPPTGQPAWDTPPPYNVVAHSGDHNFCKNCGNKNEGDKFCGHCGMQFRN